MHILRAKKRISLLSHTGLIPLGRAVFPAGKDRGWKGCGCEGTGLRQFRHSPKAQHHDGWDISHLSLVAWAFVGRWEDMVESGAEGWDAFPPHHLSLWSSQG